MKILILAIDDDVEAAEIASALEVGAEEAGLHAERTPGHDPFATNMCGDKFCSVKSHEQMGERAELLDQLAKQIRRSL